MNCTECKQKIKGKTAWRNAKPLCPYCFNVPKVSLKGKALRKFWREFNEKKHSKRKEEKK